MKNRVLLTATFVAGPCLACDYTWNATVGRTRGCRID
jgi:hypothetical protein